MGKDEIKPCPFCGWAEGYTTSNCLDQTYIECSGCGANGPSEGDVGDAVAAWNYRKGDDK